MALKMIKLEDSARFFSGSHCKKTSGKENKPKKPPETQEIQSPKTTHASPATKSPPPPEDDPPQREPTYGGLKKKKPLVRQERNPLLSTGYFRIETTIDPVTQKPKIKIIEHTIISTDTKVIGTDDVGNRFDRTQELTAAWLAGRGLK